MPLLVLWMKPLALPGTIISKLIENLNQAGAQQIIFDIEFTEKSCRKVICVAETANKYQNTNFCR